MIVGETIIGQNSGAEATVTGLKPTGYNFEYSPGSPVFTQWETIVGQTSGEDRTRMRYLPTGNNTRFGSDYPIQTDVWETIVYRLRFSTTDPLLQFYKHVGETGFDSEGRPIGGSLQLIYEDAIDKTLKSPTDKAWAFLNFTYWNGGAPQTQNMYIDDLYISTNPPPELSVLGGDFDGDGDTDGADFLEWQRDQSVGSLSDWEAGFGTSLSFEAATAVPEPTSAVLFGFAVISLLARRSRSRRGLQA